MPDDRDRKVAPHTQDVFPVGGGEIGELIRAHDWSSTPLGPIESWAPSLRTSVQNALSSAFPTEIVWGKEFIQIYNEGFAQIMGEKHPQGLGRPSPETFAEIWEQTGPLLNAVLNEGRVFWFEDAPYAIERRGFLEEGYYTFSYSPIFGESGTVEGVLITAAETTRRVLEQRYMRTMRNLVQETSGAMEARMVLRKTGEALAMASKDVPFALVYVQQADGGRADLVESVSVGEGASWVPPWMPLPTASGDPFGLGARPGLGEIFDVVEVFGVPLSGLAEPAPVEAFRVPLMLTTLDDEVCIGYVVFGINPLFVFDEPYRTFLSELGRSISRVYSAARISEEERDMARARSELIRTRIEARHLQERSHLLDSITHPFIAVDRQWRITYYNFAATQESAWPGWDVTVKVLWEVFPQIVGTSLEEFCRQAMKTGEPEVRELYFPPQERFLLVYAYPWEHGLTMSYYDVTERRRTEEALGRSEARFRAVVESALDVVAIVDGGSCLRFLSPSAEEVLGRPIEELLDHTLFDLVSLEDAHHLRGVFTRLLQFPDAPETFLISMRGQRGEVRWLSGKARNMLEHAGVEGILINIRDVTEVKRFEAEIIASKEQAEEMTRLKSSLLANMSHEIRTPLTSIIGMANLLAREVPEDFRAPARAIERGGLRLARTLESVLTLAQLEGQALEITLQDVDVIDEVDDAIRSLECLAFEKNLSIELIAGDDPIIARLDPTFLAGILNNLIGNAIKFTTEGRIEVRVEADEDSLLVEVEDTGIGISEEFLPHLFDEFRQESTGLARAHEGTGLGLAIAQRMVDAMEGEITVSSRKGVGTTFKLRLPRQHPNGAVSEPVLFATMAARPAPRLARDHRPRVLVAEDDEMIRLAVTRLLQGEFQVDAVPDAETAVRLAKETDYDLIVLDIGLPGESGLAALHALRALPVYAERPVIALTGYVMPDDRRRFLEEGFTAYVPKPFEPDRFLEQVRSLAPS